MGGVLAQLIDNNTVIKQLAFDSRRVQTDSHLLFFALQTSKNDGHNYISDLYQKKIRHFVVSNDFKEMALYPEANFIKVPDTLVALQTLARNHRMQFKIPVIGITGSNGKTTVKEWLYQLLCDDYHIAYTPNSFNSQIGVPISVWGLQADTQLGIFEAGISHPDEMNRLKSMIEPTIGILTNIGTAHDEYFMDVKQKIGEKLNLFRSVETLIMSFDNGLVNEVLLRTALKQKIKLFVWSRRKTDADLFIREVNVGESQTVLKAVYNGQDLSIRIPFIDEAAIENAIHCWACMLLLGYSNDIISERVLRLKPIMMRLEMKQGINRCLIINDTYNSDLESLHIAIDLMENQRQFNRRTLILSDILQIGSSEKELYEEIAKLLVSKKVNRIIGIGDAISRQSSVFSMEKEFYKTPDEFFVSFDTRSVENEVILVKGARRFEFERISAFLELKTHETVMEVNLNTLVSNLNYFRSKMKPTTKVMAMVKAYSYGTGDIDIANELQYHNVDYLAVAYADEGITLRNKNINLPIMVMNPDERGVEMILKNNLQPEIYNFRSLRLFEEGMKRHANIDCLRIHVKIDTGMHRLGFEKQNLPDLIRHLQSDSRLKVESVFSHFAAIEEPAEDGFTRHQVELLEECYSILSDGLGYKPLKHISNAVGLLRFPEYQFDMVRLGLGLYGVNPYADPHRISCVASLHSIVSQLKFIHKGDTVGYDRTWTAERDTLLATVPIGYADGLPRTLSGGKGKMMINGCLAPIVGLICMDMCMLDVTDIPVKEGDSVMIFGSSPTVEQISRMAGCSAYEILTGISQRVKRVFVRK